jgi:hypothetical protein
MIDLLHHHHHAESIAERIDQLMMAVFVADDHERLRRLNEHLDADFVYISPAAVVDGAQGLSDAFGHYRHVSLHNSLQRTTDVDVHHTYFRYAWRRQQDGHVTMEGWSFGWLDTDGKLLRIVSFDGLLPGQPA